MGVWGKSDEEFWSMTPRQYVDIARARERERDRDQQRADLRAGVVASEMHNAWRRKGAPARTPASFFTSLKDERKAQSPETMLAVMKAVAAAHNKRVEA